MKRVYNLLEIVGEVMGVDSDLILSRTRQREIKDARFVYIYVLKDVLKLKPISVARIARWDNASVHHACNRVNEFIQTEPGFKEKIDSLISILSGSVIQVSTDPMENIKEMYVDNLKWVTIVRGL